MSTLALEAEAEGRAACAHLARPPAMSRCECAGLAFTEIARRVRERGESFDEICHRTGCGRTCTACLPDLENFLAGR